MKFKWTYKDCSVFGPIKLASLFNNCKTRRGSIYKIKTVSLRTSSQKRDFENQIYIGCRPGIDNKAGVSVHAYGVSMKGVGIIIMDHVTFGKQGRTTMSSFDYMNSGFYNHKRFTTLLHKTLHAFYSVTNGFHGDLHENNVMVVLRNKWLEDIRLIDYGSFVPFRFGLNKRHESITFSDYMHITNQTFKGLSNNRVHKMIINGVHVKRVNGVPVRSNKDALSKLPGYKTRGILQKLRRRGD